MRGGTRTGQRGVVRHTVGQRGAPNIETVRRGLSALTGIDHHLDLPAPDGVHAMRPPLQHLVDHADGKARVADARRRTAWSLRWRSPFRSAGVPSRAARPCRCRAPTGTRSASGQHDARAQLRFREGTFEAVVQAHHLAGGFHFRAQNGVHTREPRKREHRFLHRHVRRDRGVVELEIEAAGRPAMTSAPILATGTPVALATNGTVRDGAWVDLKHIDRCRP